MGEKWFEDAEPPSIETIRFRLLMAMGDAVAYLGPEAASATVAKAVASTVSGVVKDELAGLVNEPWPTGA